MLPAGLTRVSGNWTDFQNPCQVAQALSGIINLPGAERNILMIYARPHNFDVVTKPV
ncbi:hypothetical protein EYZ11_010381 [Aspergillus tanneri]|uniref:Uncharacterized protein n=1 Tax=Aspergillus tanneri TaxID=1220188 RepID=A0A4V3UN84_9EURO|nr:hypothetical protein EYZ11_010381 [Aspergillus tanneri]